MRDYWSKWRDLCVKYGDMCFYCREEAATTLDHVLPYSYAIVNEIDNLRPACALCNCIASDKIFESVDAKRYYILDQLRRRHDLRHAFCTECGIAYTYRTHSPSLFLCPECYDLEYGTDWQSRAAWRAWLTLHEEAGWFIDVYREAGNFYRKHRFSGNRKFLTECLITALRNKEARELREVELSIRIPTT
jgi:hypothetical protein